MNTSKEFRVILIVSLGIGMLILDGRTAMEGAKSGLEVCLQTVLPALFPFIFLSSILTTYLASIKPRNNSLLCRLYRVPGGSEGILLTGLLGGYPVGARCIGEAVNQGRLSASDARRMLVFCNAAGPGFIFGITGNILQHRWVPWCLWLTHLLSGVCTARLMPSPCTLRLERPAPPKFSITQRLRQSLQVVGEICGWVVLMRTAIAMLKRWFLWYLPEPCQLFITGLLELSNGCISLAVISNPGLQFIFLSVFLAFGGLCVALQTASAASNIDRKLYLPGKCLQALISFLLAYAMQFIFFSKEQQAGFQWMFLNGVLMLIVILILRRIKRKNSCGIFEKIGV